ncbi:paraquat-inducible protein A [Sinorhizobium sp. BG8]|uniref:paraquat-inducible protein A n=1 Tax=Sinorhizobium sp. BG8 TaxID=2613773 RepID=UPI00193E16E6|nr:paraquat-inducible protein A [Sinorhizobium sp. BG8]QRM56562.1 paraquat-inducible protein A [Sinorhizobium sp. BG8]
MIWIVPLLLVFSAFSLALGLVLPLVRFEKLYFFSETPSLVEVVHSLWLQQDYALATVVALFSLVFPVVKLVGIAFEAVVPRDGADHDRLFARILPLLGKWSMMDVMLVALVIVAAKTSGLASAFSQPGLWFYAASAMAAGVLQIWLRPR